MTCIKMLPGETHDDYVGRAVPMLLKDGGATDEEHAVEMASKMYEDCQDSNDQKKAKASVDRKQFDNQNITRAKAMRMRSAVTITACADGDCEGKKGPATFQSVAYSGGLVPGYTADPPLPAPYIIDLSGTTATRSPKANLDHKNNQRVGHITDVENTGEHLLVAGVLSAATTHRDEVVKSRKDGYEWEVSIEGDLRGAKKLAEGKTMIINGRKIEGPAYVFSKAVLTGIAFVSQGADDGNSVKIAASAAGANRMLTNFEEYMESCGVDPETATDAHKVSLRRGYDAQLGAGTGSEIRKTFVEEAESIRKQQERVEVIQKMTLTALRDYPVYHEQIRRLSDAAIEGEISPKDYELELLRSTRVQAGRFSTISSTQQTENDPKMIEAAICLSAGMPNIEKHFHEDVLNAVDRAGMMNYSLQQLLIRVACANGFQCRPGDRVHRGNLREVLGYCFPPITARLAGGLSTISLPGILGSVANKELLIGYMEEDQTWKDFAQTKPVNNFHAVNSYRLLDNLEYELVGPGGDIPHGTLSQETYTRQAHTYAKMLGLTREDIINDDLGAFDDLRQRLGRGAAKKFNNIFWAAFMNNASFFTSGNTNYISGSTTNLGLDGVGLALAQLAYRQMKTPATDGAKRIGVSAGRATKLLAPPELEVTAGLFYKSLNNLAAGGSAGNTVPSANPFSGLYRPVIQDRLSDSAFTGYSATAFYLFGDNLMPMVVSFLNNQQAPTVESSEADFSNLGILFRGYHDFGADKSEYLSGIKSKGGA